MEAVAPNREDAREKNGFRFVARGPRLILYLDSSAIVKRYIHETGSVEVRAAVESSLVLGTSVLSRAEVAAAIRKGWRTKTIDEAAATEAARRFERDWPGLVRVRVNEKLVKYAAGLAGLTV